MCVKYARDLLVIPGDWRGELGPGWILCNVVNRYSSGWRYAQEVKPNRVEEKRGLCAENSARQTIH